MTTYLVATFSDRIGVETAYTLLESQQFSLKKIAILGQGYKTLNEYKLVDPNQATRQKIKLMLLLAVPFGFFAGFMFNQITHISIFPQLGDLGSGVLGGVLGAISGGLGSFSVGGGLELLLAGNDSALYRDRLRQGKYLLVVKGSETIVRQANTLLRKTNPESLQVYEAEEVPPLTT